MRRNDDERLEDVEQAIETIDGHLASGPLTDGLVFDAVRTRLPIVEEAANALPPALRDIEPETPWSDIIGLRNVLARRYFDTAFGVIRDTVDHELEPLRRAVQWIRWRIAPQG